MKTNKHCQSHATFIGHQSLFSMADDSDDILVELLSYNCPFSGKKRVAGQRDDSVEVPLPK